MLNTYIPKDGKQFYLKILKKPDFNSSNIAKVPTDKMLNIIPNEVNSSKVWYIKYF